MSNNPIYTALLKEAEFTNEMLVSGVIQIRKADFSQKGVYFQAFTSLSTGLERIGKLCLMLDFALDHAGTFPDTDVLKKKLGHDLSRIFEQAQGIVRTRDVVFHFPQDLSGPIHGAILRILTDFAKGDRYSNINLLTGAAGNADPVAAWYQSVDTALFESDVGKRKKVNIFKNAEAMATMLRVGTVVFHTAEDGSEINHIGQAAYLAGMKEAVAPLRQLYVLHFIRYWVELLISLSRSADTAMKGNLPFLNEVFAHFYNDDAFFKSRVFKG